MRALVHIEANLDQDLSTPALAGVAGLSTSRLHRVFAAEVRESPHAYVSRLRLDRAAFYLATQEGTIPPVPSPGSSPQAHPAIKQPPRSGGRAPARRPGLEQEAAEPTLSAVRAAELRAQPVAFIRHIGPYEHVDASLFDELATWSRTKRGHRTMARSRS